MSEPDIHNITTRNSKTIETFRRLIGQKLVGCRAVEMAFFETGLDGLPVFEHPELPFVQAYTMELILGNGTSVTINSQQNDDSWELSANFGKSDFIDNFSAAGKLSIFRKDTAVKVPSGTVEDIDFVFDEKSGIEEVHFSTSAGPIILIAGEVYEGWNNTFHVCKNDESVLLFLDTSRLRDVDFHD